MANSTASDDSISGDGIIMSSCEDTRKGWCVMFEEFVVSLCQSVSRFGCKRKLS